MLKPYRIEIKWAIIFFMVGILWMIIEKLTGLHDINIAKHPTFTWLFAIPAVIMYYLAIQEKREKYYNGSLNWLQGFVTGMIMAVILALLSPLSQWITHTLISPHYFENAIEHGVELGRASREEIAAMMNLKTYMMITPIMTLAMGTITSAVVALFLRRG